MLSNQYTVESSYISPKIGIQHKKYNRKEKKLIRNNVPYTKNNQSVPYFLLASQYTKHTINC